MRVQTELDASELYPRATLCPGMRLDHEVAGRVRSYEQLGPWEGVPASLDLNSVAGGFDEAWPR